MLDTIFALFLEHQLSEAMLLARESDLLAIDPVTPQHIAVQLRCKGLVKNRSNAIVMANCFTIGIYIPSDFLRRANPYEVVTWLGPMDVFHPNIRPPAICIGHLTPGTPVTDIIYRVFQIITFQKVTMREDDALNFEACAWARQNRRLLPVDARPLKRRALDLEVEVLDNGGTSA
jgi:hypothetical protein